MSFCVSAVFEDHLGRKARAMNSDLKHFTDVPAEWSAAIYPLQHSRASLPASFFRLRLTFG